MAKLADVLSAIDALGFDPKRTKVIARRLSEAGAIPAGGPARAPELSDTDTLRLIVAIATTTKLRLADSDLATYASLVPAGAIISDDAPADIPRSAFDAIELLVEKARGGDSDARRSTIEFVRGWPEIVINRPDGVSRFRAAGADAGHWERTGHRTASTVPVRVIADILDEVFGKVI
ncbi:hypothetical protein [Bradyrhizobium japonicum]|uniref:hypothetical protein n=1 Tax=Bradyrhizobium japonicum TaxID=375 RepID=UPI000456D1BA|nr:hypothetical protein [Bradyrhizobium japonicum]AHY50549.1 hypothetical protein BJS_03397 [Bradyrhizobium japonicum SEMIA 5079]MCD9109928.1 hypothetical protein [Bradyrhizobium japonicum]MCD9256666.1 hypothetical protein [Bradyrhizobium japonicum SEMIA 5079]MCD9910390.1 hypothetical protein [Bradyrhizobium japonicum]MCS3977507.1 hypothetical protein [Bradyrhizobium japonicum]